MKIAIDIINFESEETNFIIKIKSGTTVLQTSVGNQWNQRFLLDNKRNTEIKIEAWQKIKDDHQFIGSSIVPKIEQPHKLSIKHNNKELGLLNILYKEMKDAVTQQIYNQDSLNTSKIEKQTKTFQRINDSLSLISNPIQDFSSIDEYFGQNFNNQDLFHNPKITAAQMVQESLDKVLANFSISHVTSNIDEVENENQDINEKKNIEKLQKQLIKIDLSKLEKKRRQLNNEILQLDELYNQLRIDQIDQKLKVAALRKDLIEKLLYLEDKINLLRKEISKQKHHVFASNPNLLNSEIEISQVNIQKQFLEKWQKDPNFENQRVRFIEEQMKQWNLIQEKRKKHIQQEEAKILEAEKVIEEKKKLLQETTNTKKRDVITENLKQLSESQLKRKSDLLIANKHFEEKKSEKYLALKYAEQDAMHMLELQAERKQILQKLKNPDFEGKEIADFEEKFKLIHKEKQLKRKKQWDDREAKWNKFKAQYYSESYEKARQQHIEQYENEDAIEEQKQKKLEKLSSYIQEVKMNFQPQVSVDKKAEMEVMKRNLKYEPDFKKYKSLSQKVKDKHIFYGVDYQEVLKKSSKIKLVPLNQLPTKISPREIGDFYLKQNATFNKKHIPPLKSQKVLQQSTPLFTKPQVIDFLKEQRIKKAKLLKIQQPNVLDKEDQLALEKIQQQLSMLQKY